MVSEQSKKALRKKQFVSKAIQGRLMIRMVMYCGLLMLSLCTVLLLQFCVSNSGDLISGNARTVGSLFGDFLIEQCSVILTVTLFLAPLICLDMMKLSHRFAGPLVRFESVLNKMKQGEILEPVKLRKGDLMGEFQDVFNDFIAVHNERLEQLEQLQQQKFASKEQQSGESEQKLLEEIQQQQQELQTGNAVSNSLS